MVARVKAGRLMHDCCRGAVEAEEEVVCQKWEMGRQVKMEVVVAARPEREMRMRSVQEAWRCLAQMKKERY